MNAKLLSALKACRDRFLPADQPERDRDIQWDEVNEAVAAAEAQQAEPVNPLVLGALKLCQGRFAFYVGHHIRSGDLEKAAQNQFFADLAAKAIAVAEGKEEGPLAEPVRLTEEELRKALQLPVNKTTLNICRVEAAVLRKQGYKVEG